MHVVADTNTVVSGLLWYGNPRQVLDATHTGVITLATSAPLLAELAEVLQRPKFAQRLARANVTSRTLVFGYAALARLVMPAAMAMRYCVRLSFRVRPPLLIMEKWSS